MFKYLIRKGDGFLKSLDKKFSQNFFIESEEAHFKHFKRSKPFLDTSFSHLPLEARSSFSTYNNTEQYEYLLQIKGTHYIEPRYGWIFDKNLKTFFTYSFPHSDLEKKPSFFKIKFKKYKIIKLDTVISLRYYFHNYWHFFNDILGQIAYIDQHYKDPGIPLLVPHGVLEIPYIKQIIESSPNLKCRNWIVQHPKTLIEARQIILAKMLPNTGQNFINILGLLGENLMLKAPVSSKRLFLKRSNKRGRALNNLEEIERLLLKYDFNIVDTDNLSFEEQKQTFSNAGYVIGIHGAGLTNLIFRYPNPLQLVEIFPNNLIPPHYYWLCNQLGFSYDCLIGGTEEKGLFHLDATSLEKLLIKLKPTSQV